MFKPEYKEDEKYGYANADEKNNLKGVLAECSEGYCMYCFSRIRVDGKLYANLEHAIEKNNSNKLIECIPNIGISCSVCNQTFKRIGERNRKIPKSIMCQFEKFSQCSIGRRKRCMVPCKSLRKLQESYSDLPDAEIILQPMGIRGSDSGEELALQYNVMKMEFEPATDRYTYSDREIIFINAHINRFRLNDPEYRTHQLCDFIKNVIDNEGKIPAYEYNNLIVKLFQEKVSGRPRDEILKICKSIYVIMFPKM